MYMDANNARTKLSQITITKTGLFITFQKITHTHTHTNKCKYYVLVAIAWLII